MNPPASWLSEVPARLVSCNCLAICKTGVEKIHYAGLLTTKTAKTAKRLFFAVFAVFAVQLFQPG
jgi:hypothetical protein